MSLDLFKVYESYINGRTVKVIRDESNIYIEMLYIKGKYVGMVPFYDTIKRVIELEDINYPAYSIKNIGY